MAGGLAWSAPRSASLEKDFFIAGPHNLNATTRAPMRRRTPTTPMATGSTKGSGAAGGGKEGDGGGEAGDGGGGDGDGGGMGDGDGEGGGGKGDGDGGGGGGGGDGDGEGEGGGGDGDGGEGDGGENGGGLAGPEPPKSWALAKETNRIADRIARRCVNQHVADLPKSPRAIREYSIGICEAA